MQHDELLREESDLKTRIWDKLVSRIKNREIRFIAPTNWFVEQFNRFGRNGHER